jgi:LSD1 subclass zinc finger protein
VTNVEPRELRCNACGAALHYEPGAAVITCGHCGTEYALETPVEGVIEFSLEEAEDDAPDVAARAEAQARPYEAEALAWLREGRKKQAVDAVRAHAGMSPREATEYVDELAVRERMAPPRRRSAAVALVLAVVIALALVGLLLHFMAAR